MLLSDMAHEGAFGPVEGMVQIALWASDESGLENSEIRKKFDDVIACVSGLPSYLETRFSTSSI